MSVKFLDDTGLSYFWGKIKSYVIGLISSKADDSDVVHKTGNETIAGKKTFSTGAAVRERGVFLAVENYHIDKGTAPSTANYHTLIFCDKNGNALANRFGFFENLVEQGTGKVCTKLGAYKNAANSTDYAELCLWYWPDGTKYATCPTPPSSSNSNAIATTEWVNAKGYITSSGNAATATKLANARTISLSGAMTGSASFDGSANSEISTVWRSCVLGQSGSSATNPWYKVAECSMSELDDSTITFLVEGTYSWHSTGILKIHVRTESDSKVKLDATEIFWVSCTRSIAEVLDQYVLVCPTTASPTVELWTKITGPYMHRRFTVLSEGSRAYVYTRWTLFNASTAGQAASITTSGTQIESSITSVSTYCTGNASTVSGTAGTSLLAWDTENTLYTIGGHAVKAKLPANPNINWTSHLYAGASNGNANAATTNGNTYLIICDDTIARDRRLIKGTGATTVTSDANGVITVDSINTTYSVSTTGSGNAVTNVSLSGTAITATKGTTFLTSHQDISGKVNKSGDTLTGNLLLKVSETRGVAPSAYKQYYTGLVVDSAGNGLGGVLTEYFPSKTSRTRLIAYNATVATGGGVGELTIGCDSNGNVYTVAPTPPTADNSTQIATTAFVKAQGYLTSQSLNDYVTLYTQQNVDGSKFFRGAIGKKHDGQDVTIKSPSSDVWSIFYFLDVNNQSMLDFNVIQGNNLRNFWIRMFDMNKAQHWMFNIVLPADASSAGYINMPHTYPMSSANTLGNSNHKWGSVWAVNGAIQTSDERVKEDIAVIPDEVLDAWEQIEWLQFKMKDSVKAKGSKARLHSGIIAQRVKTAFDSLGVNSADYGFFCWDKWDTIPASCDEEGNIIIDEIPANDQYSIRYDEALAIEAAYQRRENSRLKKRIADLEERLAALELKAS